jgi:hypothetical protein
MAFEKSEAQRRLYKMSNYISKNEIIESNSTNLEMINKQKAAKLRLKKKTELVIFKTFDQENGTS